MVNKIVVVILNFKVKNLALKCINSVKKSSWENLEIVMVDNNSQDGLEEETNKLEGVKFIQTGKNLGYTGGNNIGIKKGLEMGAELILILNPDTTISKDIVEILAKSLEKEDAGIIGPKIYFSSDSEKKIWYAGGVFDTANVIGSHRGVNEEDHGQYNKIEETDYVSGAAMMVKAEVFNKIGFFDERYFLYYEDSDFCFRARKAGFKIIYNPKAIVYHENAKSTGLGSPLQDYFITRNRMYFASKFLPFRTKFALLREGIRNLGSKIRRMALFDFLTSNFGKGSFVK